VAMHAAILPASPRLLAAALVPILAERVCRAAPRGCAWAGALRQPDPGPGR
jgi:hypothetical protein